MRPLSARFFQDTIVITSETFPLDVVAGWTRVDGSTLTTTACVQAANLQDRPMEANEQSSQRYGIGHSSILLTADPGSLIDIDTKITHTAGPRGAISPPVVYSCEGSPVPPGGGMMFWTVAVKREG